MAICSKFSWQEFKDTYYIVIVLSSFAIPGVILLLALFGIALWELIT